ncbi:MAG: hypothetical protein ACPLQP_05605 [Moorellaceae bacterium]
MVEDYPKYDYLDIQQTFFVWYRSEKGYYWEWEAEPGGPFDISLAGTTRPLTDETKRQLRKEIQPPFLLELPETTGYLPRRVLEEETKLFLEFAELATTCEGILKFANKYGRLTYGETQVQTPKHRKTVFGESLGFWQWEIRDMAWAVWVWEALKEEDEGFLRRVIYWSDDGQAVGYVLLYPKEVLTRFESAAEAVKAIFARNNQQLPEDTKISWGWLASEKVNREVFRRCRPGDFFLPARYLLQATINEKLKVYATRPVLLLGDKNNLVPYLMPENLLGAMWLQLYFAAVGEKRFKRCSACGDWEDVTDKTAAWTKHEACANKKRVEKYRQAVRKAQRLYREGKPLEEIAAELGRPIEWVRKQVAGLGATATGRGKS